MPRPENFPNPNPSEVLNRAEKQLARLVNDKEVIFGQPCAAAKLVFELDLYTMEDLTKFLDYCKDTGTILDYKVDKVHGKTMVTLSAAIGAVSKPESAVSSVGSDLTESIAPQERRQSVDQLVARLETAMRAGGKTVYSKDEMVDLIINAFPEKNFGGDKKKALYFLTKLEARFPHNNILKVKTNVGISYKIIG